MGRRGQAQPGRGLERLFSQGATGGRTGTVQLSGWRLSALAAFALVLVAGGCGDGPRSGGSQMVGRWQPAEVPSVRLPASFSRSTAQIMFARDGTWKASDGCRPLRGRYVFDPSSGEFGSKGSSAVAVGCAAGQIPYSSLLDRTDRVTFASDGTAVFRSAAGRAVLKLVPVP